VKVIDPGHEYLDGQDPHRDNISILNGLRQVLVAFEMRAAERHGCIINVPWEPEAEAACPTCGHWQCEHMENLG
jgi:hypothetical protein